MFTQDNTEGFNPEQLKKMNAALNWLVRFGWETKAASELIIDVYEADLYVNCLIHEIAVRLWRRAKEASENASAAQYAYSIDHPHDEHAVKLDEEAMKARIWFEEVDRQARDLSSIRPFNRC